MMRLFWSLLLVLPMLLVASCGREAPLATPVGTVFEVPTFVDDADNDANPFGEAG